jgi:hypothetical protein
LDELEYTRLRSKQSNWETVLQVLGLRTQPENVSEAVRTNINLKDDPRWAISRKNNVPAWTFTFTVNASSIFTRDGDPLAELYSDCRGVPMITGLEEVNGLDPRLCIDYEKTNIVFSIEDE